MDRKTRIKGLGVMVIVLLLVAPATAQEDRVSDLAIQTFRSQVRLPQETEIRLLEKKESAIPDFYSVKLLLIFPDKEVPAVIYVDKAGEKVIIGNLFIKGENVTAKEAGPHRLKKVDMATLDMDKSPSLGPKGAKVTIVEFSNFQCPFCTESWAKLKTLLTKYPKDLRYVFKHFPFQPFGKTFELSLIAAAAQEVSNEAFWLVHDFLFTNEGQSAASLEKKALQSKIEQLLREKKHDVKAFQKALELGHGQKRVLDDMALGDKLRITGTPTKIINGDMIIGLTPDSSLESYLKK
jgi:protein-disulfide isomerase